MSSTISKTPTPAGIPAATFNRILDEGYGPGAWYGSDLRAAIADVRPATAVLRPARGPPQHRRDRAPPCVLGGRDRPSKLDGRAGPAFPLEGEDWFDLGDDSRLSWAAMQSTVDAAQRPAEPTVAEIGERSLAPRRLSEAERFDLVLGITGHAAYHAGQIQLVKKLIG